MNIRSIKADLLLRVEDFIDRHEMTANQFGLRSLNNSALVGRIRAGRMVNLKRTPLKKSAAPALMSDATQHSIERPRKRLFLVSRVPIARACDGASRTRYRSVGRCFSRRRLSQCGCVSVTATRFPALADNKAEARAQKSRAGGELRTSGMQLTDW
jgi:hypothetical protein